jgi:hypothetical protein
MEEAKKGIIDQYCFCKISLQFDLATVNSKLVKGKYYQGTSG